MANVALALNHGRQNPLVVDQIVNFDNVADTAVAINVARLPMGAIITGGYITSVVASNIGTSQAILLTGAGAALVAAFDAKGAAGASTAFTAASCGKNPLATGGYVTATPTNVGGAATAGKFRVVVEYIIEGRAAEAQP
jgi:hypothetical protein